jgi:hypothetical protein
MPVPLSFSWSPTGELLIESHPFPTPELPAFNDEVSPMPPREFVAQGDQVRQAGTLGEERELVELYKEKLERDLFAFNYTVMGGENILQPVPHQLFCNFLQSVPPKRKLLLAPRGHLKTTLAGGLALHFFVQPDQHNIYFPQQIGALGHSDGRSTRALLSSKSLPLSSDRLVRLKTLLETNKLFHGFWPQVFWEDPTKQAKTWNNEELLFQRKDIFVEPSLKCIGVGGTITGYHFNVHLHDDLIDIKDRASATTMKTAFDWFVASRALMDNIQESLEITTGTHWANNDLYTLIRENDHSVESQIFSALKQGTVDQDPRTQHTTLSQDALPLWPEVFPLSLLDQLAQPEPYGVGGLFPLCYLNDPYHRSVVDFDPHQIRFYTLEGDSLVFQRDIRDDILQEVFGVPEIPDYLLKGMKFDKEGYDVMRERLRDRTSKIYFNGR